ncbi:MAG: aminotransferase class III-fold pyridoxal phosphate-dependent enzyme [Gaiellaceae bacterium MAG52_C11]|nr:aminotransferase class III-fold pyridoxal phosphate-dependent enzyme [Candidatus Gaiellasilicea maunaloa]
MKVIPGREKSARLNARAVRRIPGGVNSNVRLDAPRVFFERGQGAWLWDVDGNDYVDYLLGQGPAFLGHAPEPVLQAVEAASRKGMVYGAQHPLEVEAAERLCELLGWAEMVRLGSTGTEMVQAALRLARAATGREQFVRFEGHYHGWLDNVLIAPQPGPAAPASAGQLPEALADSIVLPWNDLDLVAETLEQRGDEICAVLMEPAMLNAGAVAPDPGYLGGVREVCRRTGVLLIFDEVITGFRLAAGGAAERFGVAPDLAVYGKAMAGGWPVAALAGPAALMERFGSKEVTHAGTLNANVMASAATVATLELLLTDPPYARIEEIGAKLMAELGELAASASLPLRIQGFPAAFHASFGEPGDARTYRDLQALDAARYARLAQRLFEEGVWVAARGIWYVSAAHGERELEITLERAAAALEGA